VWTAKERFSAPNSVRRNEDGKKPANCAVLKVRVKCTELHRYPNSTCCVTTRHARRVVRVAPLSFHHGGRRRSVYKFSLLCSGFASISGTTSGKSDVDTSIAVHAVATPRNTCRASRACLACLSWLVCRTCYASCGARVAVCCPTSATQHVTTFFLWQYSVPCRDMTRQVEFGLISPK